MALTSEEEAKVKAIIAAFDGAQQVADLPAADTSSTDKQIEVYDRKTGTAQQMSLKDAVDMGQNLWCGRVWNLDNATPQAATYVGSLELLRELPIQLGFCRLACRLVIIASSFGVLTCGFVAITSTFSLHSVSFALRYLGISRGKSFQVWVYIGIGYYLRPRFAIIIAHLDTHRAATKLRGLSLGYDTEIFAAYLPMAVVIDCWLNTCGQVSPCELGRYLNLRDVSHVDPEEVGTHHKARCRIQLAGYVVDVYCCHNTILVLSAS